MKMMPGALSLHVVEDNKQIASEQRHAMSNPIARPIPSRSLVRPVAVKVVRPIPQRISEQFYNEAFEEGLTLKETGEAAALASDWHRKWTQQDEQNHTTPDADFYSANILEQDQLNVDRQGARNPSLIASDSSVRSAVPEVSKRAFHSSFSPRAPSPANDSFILFNPEDRLSASSWSDDSSLSSHMAPQVKRRFVGDGTPEEDRPRCVAPISIRPLAVRPSAVRPMASRPVVPEFEAGVPQNVVTMRRYENLSPMSFTEDSVRYEAPEMTVVDPVQKVVHVVEDCDEDSCVQTCRAPVTAAVSAARDNVLHSLAVTQGDVDSPKFKQSLDPLLKYFDQKELDTRPHLVGNHESVNGMWLTLSKPSYFGCLGENDNGDPMYTLGRMSFDMFAPTNLVCSLQGNFNPVEVVTDDERKQMLECVPKALRQEVESGTTVLRTYHIVSAFTIEPSSALFPKSPNKDVHRPIKGIMTTYGYSLPDPEIVNRHSIWFTGGRIEPNTNPHDISEWKRLFALHPPKHTFGEKAKLLAIKLLMGATVPESVNQDGSMEYSFTRPIGGHGLAYVEVVYLDETLRIVRGHRGTIFVFSRLKQDQNQRE